MATKAKSIITLRASYGGTIAKAQYENDKVQYDIEEVITDTLTEEQIYDRQAKLAEICKALYQSDIDAIKGVTTVKRVASSPEPKKENDYDVDKRMNVIAAISQCNTASELNVLGKQIAAKKNTFKPDAYKEITNEFNTKMKALKNGVAA